MGSLGSIQLSEALPLQRFVLCQLPEYGDGRQKHARLRAANQFLYQVVSPSGPKGESRPYTLGQCELCLTELRAKQSEFALQPAGSVTIDPYFERKTRYRILESWHDAGPYRERQSEHARLHC